MNDLPFRQVDGVTDDVYQYTSDFTYNRMACAGIIDYEPGVQREGDNDDSTYQNSNFDAIFEMKKSDCFVDPVLANIVDNLMDQAPERQSSGIEVELNLREFQKTSSNISVVSTNASDDTNSCERSHSDFCCKAGRSDSLSRVKHISRKDSNSASDCSQSLFEIPEQTPSALIESMMYTTFSPDSKFDARHECDSEGRDSNLSVKKPIPNKYKTEICRNWKLEGFCRFGDECTFAHGGPELVRRTSMPSNYKTKICKQFSEEPFYCPYGEKCQFLHISELHKSDQQFKYTEILEVTTKQIESSLKNSTIFEEFEISNPVFKVSRLQIFKNLTDI